jgi:hypothetical protein
MSSHVKCLTLTKLVNSQLIAGMKARFEKDVADLQKRTPVAAVMVMLYPDDGYINMSNM